MPAPATPPMVPVTIAVVMVEQVTYERTITAHVPESVAAQGDDHVAAWLNASDAGDAVELNSIETAFNGSEHVSTIFRARIDRPKSPGLLVLEPESPACPGCGERALVWAEPDRDGRLARCGGCGRTSRNPSLGTRRVLLPGVPGAPVFTAQAYYTDQA